MIRFLSILIVLCLPVFADAFEEKKVCDCDVTGVCECVAKCVCNTFISAQAQPDLLTRTAALEASVAALQKDVNSLKEAFGDIKTLLLDIKSTVRQSCNVPTVAAPVVTPTVGGYYQPPTVYYSTFAADPTTACANGQCGAAMGGQTVIYQRRGLFGRFR